MLARIAELTKIRALAIAALVLTMLLLAGIAYAQGSSNEIHACAMQPLGRLRIVDQPRDCGPNETYLRWNIQGPAGPPGTPQFYNVRKGPVTIHDGQTLSVIIDCSPGDGVTGGGHGFLPNLDAIVAASAPHTANSWVVTIRNPPGGPGTYGFFAYAVCADL